jgi:Tol biopolymer transport system component
VRVRCAAGFIAAAWLTAAAGTRLEAQNYFGRNKVHYKQLNFKILRTEHFDIYFYPSEREGIDISARLAERWHARLERLLSHTLRGRQPLVLYAAHPDFEQTNAIQGELSEGTGGVTEPLRRRIVLPLGGPLGDTDHVIGHELVHAFQFDITTNPNAPPGQNGAERLPLWFIEGMAEYLSIGPVDPNTAMWLRDAARATDGKDKLPSIDDLDDPKYFPYRWGQALWAYIGGRFGDDAIKPLLAMAAASGDLNGAFKRVLGVTTKELSADWQASIRRDYLPILEVTTPPSETGRLLIKSDDLGAQLNVGPTLSPDGRLIAFLSERSFFSIDLFVADASTGKILHKLTSNATDPHYSSIQFIYSAGAWDRESKRIAIATVTEGHPALAIFNAQSGGKDREVPIPGLDEIFNPTWAPDGHAVCFTGMSHGLTDLYVYDLGASQLRQLTNDAYADLQPAWSPDGTRIAFATDRFTTDLDTLAIGAYRLAIVTVEGPGSGSVAQVRAFPTGKHINPQWSPDGRSLYFISDRDGIPNLYRVRLVSGPGEDITQLTRVGTGLSGITNTSPALSVAASTGIAAFSVYQDGKYDIYTVDESHPRTSSIPLSPASMLAASLPPLDRKPSDMAQLLADASYGLPAETSGEAVDYRPSLTLEAAAQPSIGIGASRFGAAIGGGVGFLFSDMLGDHVLSMVLQIDSGLANDYSLKNTAAQVGYVNQAHRWNWGLEGGQVPYLSGGFTSGLSVSPQGELLQIDRTIIFRQTERSASAIAAYPFSRARRVEFKGGVSQLSFDQVVRTTTYSLNTGRLLNDRTDTISLARPLTLGTSLAALVDDRSNYGATSPVQGQRYRLEASPTFGSINFTSLLADYRRYFMPVSFYTLATRVTHYGRYGTGADDQRLFPLFLGYPNFVRGYDIGTFDSTECVPTVQSQCPTFDRLIGSRVLVGSLEFRFPLLRPFGVSPRMYGPVPVEVAFFADGGVAWNRGEKPSFLGGSRDGVGSAGIAFRMNLFGFAVGEFDFARPFQRPGKGWVFQFNLIPGF